MGPRLFRPITGVAAAGAVAGALLVPVLTAPPAQAAPTFLGTLAGPSQAAMYPSGEQYDAANNRLVVADTGRDRILIYSLTGTKISSFGSYGTKTGQFASPRDVAVDDSGRIYVADAENNRVQAFTASGTFRWSVGGLSQGADTLNTPIGLTWDSVNDVLLVADTGQSLVKAYSASGTRLWNSPTGDALGTHAVRDVARGPDGRLWLSAYREHQVRVYDVSPDGQTWNNRPVFVLGDGAAEGSGVNQLNFPYNVAWSPNGKTVYVSDTGNGRIARWDLTDPTHPAWLTPFGGHCANHPQPCEDPPGDAGKFNHLRRVTVDSAGNIYGADFWGAGIEVFRPDGTSLREIEGFEPPAPGVSEAFAVDVGPDGQVYVMDRLNHRIERFTAGGAYVNKVGARGTQPATFSWPEGLTVAPNGRVWAVDTRGGRIENFPADLATTPKVKSYGSTGTGAGQMTYPSNADVAANGVVWIADTRNDRLMRFDPATESFLSPIGGTGSGAGKLKNPMGIAVTANAVYVADTGNDRVQKLSLSGQPQASFGTGLSGPQGVEVAPDGTVWVADTLNSRLVHLSANLTSRSGGFGSKGSGDNQFFEPHDLAFGNGKLYVADTYNNRVQVFQQPTGTGGRCASGAASYRASLASGPAVLRYALRGAELCVDGHQAQVIDKGASRAAIVAPSGVTRTMSKLGLRFRYDGSGKPRATELANGSARVRVSGDWAACLDLGRGKVLRRGIAAAADDATGRTRSRLLAWSPDRIVASSRIPTGVKRQIAELGVADVARSTLRRLSLDVVDRAFAKKGATALARLVDGVCVPDVWAPTVTVRMTRDGHLSTALAGTVKRLVTG